ncbi:MAG: ferritin-like domain-containing protein [Caldilineaceae bacterium]
MTRTKTSSGMGTQISSMEDLFVDQLRDLYSAEDQIIQALPQMAQAANSSELKTAFQQHLEQTRTHKQRLDRIFSTLNMSSSGQKCEGMEGLLKEGQEALQLSSDSLVKDAALIAAAQRVEHYEMAGYGTVRTFADQLGHSDAKDLLQQTLNEEGEADKKLTSLAEGGMFKTGINEKASMNAGKRS